MVGRTLEPIKWKMTARGRIIPALLLAILLAWVGAASGQATVYFRGKITEISKAMAMGLGKTGTFFIIKLDSKPKLDFRISQEDAVKFGLIEATGSAAVLTPKQLKGVGWQVKLTCSKEEQTFGIAPIYWVRSVERMND